MAGVTPYKIVGDVSHLPDHAFGTRSVIFWGTLAFMIAEGMGFVLSGGGYLYLMGQNPQWPPGGTRPPDLLWGTLFTLLLLVSAIPNWWTDKASQAHDKPQTQVGLLVVLAFALAALGLRGFELAHLNTRWDADAYGSIVWALMFLHTTHIVTDMADTAVLSCFMFRRDVDGERFADVEDNAGYWVFVIVTWLPVYVLVYWVPRLM
jgi:heme/copper-type cytochrome/quinol oxidase subunit 3